MWDERGLLGSSDRAGGKRDVAIAIRDCGEEYGIRLSRRSAISVERRSPRTYR